MNIFITLAVLTTIKNVVMGETRELTKEMYPKSTIKIPSKGHVSTSTTNSLRFDSNVNTLWRYHPGSQYSSQIANESRPVALRPPLALTRLAKTLSYGFDPYFKQGYFEPFEKRPKPITLVAFRKNGLIPRQSIKVKPGEPAGAAELQSPYNDVGNFWQDDFGQS